MTAVQLNVAAALSGLKDFQRRTVDYVFDRMYNQTDATRRFLVADEVGLGKTLVARGIVASRRAWNGSIFSTSARMRRLPSRI